MNQQLGFHIDLKRCIGCNTCSQACIDHYDLKPKQPWRRVRQAEGGKFPKPFVYWISMSCNHCEDPACMKACPTGAYTKRDDGLVIHNPERCIGCGYCTWACPYSAPVLDQDKGVMSKCQGCHERVDEGQNPVCVDACLTRAIDFGPMDQLQQRHPEAVSQISIMPDNKQTRPALLITPHRDCDLQVITIKNGHDTIQLEQN